MTVAFCVLHPGGTLLRPLPPNPPRARIASLLLRSGCRVRWLLKQKGRRGARSGLRSLSRPDPPLLAGPRLLRLARKRRPHSIGRKPLFHVRQCDAMF